MNVFSTLAQLVKERQSGTVIVPDIKEEVGSIKPKLDTLQKAGFTAIHNELESRVRTLEREENTALMINRFVNDGYLILDIPYYFVNGWKYQRPVFVKPIQKKIPRIVETFNFWRTKTFKKESWAWVDSDHSLMLCQHYDWRGGVPLSVAETLIEFQEKYNLQNAHTDFKILAVLPNDQIRSYVKSVDPILLYSLDGHNGSRFVVVAWWGADIAAIEKELDLDRDSFRAVKVLGEFQ